MKRHFCACRHNRFSPSLSQKKNSTLESTPTPIS
uniref:Uncharacterized protein n=1 Tax=Anguilla anguilla TaxID=7936 RepID=A0A0E9T674_ANGAN